MRDMDYFFWLQQYNSRSDGYFAARSVVGHLVEMADDCHDNSAYAYACSVMEMSSSSGGMLYGGLLVNSYSASEIIEMVSSGCDLPVASPRNIPDEWKHVVVNNDCTKYGNVGVVFRLDLPVDIVLDQINVLIETLKEQGDGFKVGDYNERLRTLELQRFIKKHGGFSPASGKIRAAGLWLWDRVHELGNSSGVAAKVLREFRASADIRAVGLEDVEDSDLRFYLRRTSECIEKPGVLSFSKKGTRKNK